MLRVTLAVVEMLNNLTMYAKYIVPIELSNKMSIVLVTNIHTIFYYLVDETLY